MQTKKLTHLFHLYFDASSIYIVNHLVANAGVWSSCAFDQITNITAFTKLMVNLTS
jgi:hypothetical protein